MRNRHAIIKTLTTLFVLSWLAFASWFGLSWADSQPYSVETVLGASTEVASIEPLAPYPKLIDKKPDTFGARHYILYNVDSGKIMLEESAEEEVPVASTTKLMTTYLVEKYGNYTDTVITSKTGATQVGSIMGLFNQEEITVENLMYGAMLLSGNDAAHSLATYIGGILLNDPNATEEARVSRFVEEMNLTAESFGMLHTHYKDPAGLNDEGRSTAHDIAKLLSQYILKPRLRSIIGTAQHSVTNVSGRTKHDLRNSNRMVADYLYEGVIGGKTGFTPDAGHCLATAATRNGVTLIGVVLSTYSDTKEASAIEVRKLLDYGFTQYQWY